MRSLPVDVPKEIHVLLRASGGWQDYARSLRGLGMAQHLAHTDPTLPFWQRWLGDATPTVGYGSLLEGLVFGHRAATAIAAMAVDRTKPWPDVPDWEVVLTHLYQTSS